MQTRKLLTSVVCVLMLVFSVLTITGCDVCEHEWGEWSVSSPSTCSAQGTKQRKCSKCDEVQSESIDIADHDYDTENLVWNWNGYGSATVTLSCITDSTHTRQINANITDEVTSAPSCTANGKKVYTATVKIDGVAYTATKTEILAPLGHTEVTDAAVAATCERNGLTEGSHCSVCNEVLVAQQKTPMTAHTSVKIDAVAATCYSEGATEGSKCSICNKILVAPRPTDKIAHTEVSIPAVAATCSKNGLTEGKKCSVCSEVLVAQQSTDKLSHTETTLLGVAPSCSEEGLTEGKKCTVCGTVTTAQKPIGKLPHTEEKVVGKAPTCSATGLSGGKRCSVCKETLVAQTILPKTACDYESVVTAPTCEAQGYTTHTCSMCKDSFVDSYTAKLGHNWGAWEVSGSYTLRDCTNECNCGKSQRVTSINATYNGIRLLTGESVWKNDVTVTVTLSDNTIIGISDFTLENDEMTVDGSNYVDVKFHTVSTKIAVPAIYDNLPGTTSAIDFTYTEKDDAVTITGFKGASVSIVIPSYIDVDGVRVPVRYIADSAFANNDIITSVTIAPSVKNIGKYAFQNIKYMTNVVLCEGLESIAGGAFMGCPITELVIPNSVTTISTHEASYNYKWDGAFEGCGKLTTVTLGNKLTAISRETFRDCTSLVTVVIGERVESVGVYAFAGCSELTDVTIGASVISLGDYAFNNCIELASIDIPSNVESIGLYCFHGCERLEDVGFNEGLKSIAGGAFMGCPITELVIPNSVTTISTHEASYNYKWDGAFEGCGKLTTVTLGNKLTAISRETFRDCTALVSVIIGKRVETIGDYAFAGCVLLETINYDHVSTISDNAFEGCLSLKSIDLGTGVNSVGSYAFAGCAGLTSVVIPSNITSLGDNVFDNCTALNDVTFVNGKDFLRSFGSNVFNGCANLERLYFTGTSDDWASITINSDNVYPLSVTPYYYSPTQPTKAGNYWYYNKSGEKRIWNVSEDAFRAEEYSENFSEIFASESSSYATTFYNDLQDDTTLMLGIQAWELIHITAEPSYIFDLNKGLISKKELYKFTLYDILTGEDAEVEALFFEFFDTASAEFMLYIGDMYLGDPEEAPIDIKMLYNILYDQDASAIRSVLEKALSPTIIDDVNAIIDFAENAYEALKAVSQYVALSQLKSGYVDVLTAISNDKSNPKDLRDAAKELVDWYQDACELTLAQFRLKSFVNATNEDIYSWTLDKLVDVAIDSDTTGILKAVNFTGKAMRAIAEPFNLDDFCEAYYRLKTSVGAESALRKIIQVTVPDYMRYENQGTSESYMCAVELYEKSVLCGFDYSVKLLTAYVASAHPSEEGIANYNSLVATLNTYKAQKEKAYSTFENAGSQRYEAYYS